jgi:hypothetical protein
MKKITKYFHVFDWFDFFKNFGFYIFKNNIQELNDRLNTENQLQHLCLTLNIPLLNDRIEDKYLYKNQIYMFK